MERSKSFQARFARILLATNTEKDSELAKILGINQSSIVAARKRQQIPTGWIEQVSERFNINANWLFFGEAPMRFDSLAPVPQPQPQQPETQPETALCPRCVKLEAELEREKEERRELSTENRQLYMENKQLQRENGELKIEVAVQREQLKSLSGRSVAMDCA